MSEPMVLTRTFDDVAFSTSVVFTCILATLSENALHTATTIAVVHAIVDHVFADTEILCAAAVLFACLVSNQDMKLAYNVAWYASANVLLLRCV